jgi:hypothetical protein
MVGLNLVTSETGGEAENGRAGWAVGFGRSKADHFTLWPFRNLATQSKQGYSIPF